MTLTSHIKCRPILFSGEMVRAILNGRKTQTRRVVKPQPHGGELYGPEEFEPLVIRNGKEVPGNPVYGIYDSDGEYGCICPFGKPGDQLWLREATFHDGDVLYYYADGDCCKQIPECCSCEVGRPKVKPSIYMPRSDCRITLEITDVRVERVHEISEQDVLAEGWRRLIPGERLWEIINKFDHPVFGLPDWTSKTFHHGMNVGAWNGCPQQSFRYGWDSINAKRDGGVYSWLNNPFVWVIEFKRIEEVLNGSDT